MIGFLGEALIDLIGGTSEKGESLFHYYSGGCALNAATAASRLGSPVTYIGKLSKDMFGVQMKDYFKKNNVNVIPFLTDVKENSMIGFAKLDKTGAASYVFYTQGTTISTLSSDDILKAIESIDNLDYLHVGSVSIALEQSGNQILKALLEMKNLPLIFFDPNVRPTVIEDFDLYRERVLKVASMSSIIKLSHEDLEFLFPDISQKEALKVLFAGRVQVVLFTMGKDGLRWISENGLDITVPAIDNPIVDTVGAGDTVSGATLTYLSEHGITNPLDVDKEKAYELMDFAVRCAAVTTSRKGANPPFRSEVN
ncbi:MAG: carbohydrate kinase [Spirochaetia bacterium]|nr:carbohydrate kinase [Spirochaetia bacterium]